MDHTVMCRQTLSGGNYELLAKGSFEPNPDYWTLLLWKRVMGTRALSANVIGADHLRAYSFCGKESGVVLVVINLAQETTYEISVKGIQGIFGGISGYLLYRN
jgi:heparanase 1